MPTNSRVLVLRKGPGEQFSCYQCWGELLCKCGYVVYAYNPGTGDGEILTSQRNQQASGSVRETVSRNKVEGSREVTSKVGLWLPHAQVHMCILIPTII